MLRGRRRVWSYGHLSPNFLTVSRFQIDPFALPKFLRKMGVVKSQYTSFEALILFLVQILESLVGGPPLSKNEQPFGSSVRIARLIRFA